MSRLAALTVIALAAATILAATASREPFASRLVRLEAAAAIPEMVDVIEHEPVAVNAVLLEYADSPALRLNAHLAMLGYPQLGRAILPLYGNEPEFREVLASYGPAVLLPIAYFMGHEIRSLRVMRAAGVALTGAKHAALSLLGIARTDHARGSPGGTDASAGEPTPAERGWYAIGFIRKEGHDFLGQFVVDTAGQVQWVQTERITEAASEFFSSGIRSLETRYLRNQKTSAADFLWAGVDLALSAGAVKVLRVGRVAGARAGAAGTTGASASLVLRNVLRGGRAALRVGRYALPVAVTYAVVRHPSLLSGLAAQAANLLGWPVPLVQAALWFVILLPLLMFLALALGWLVRPTLFTLRAATRAVIRLQRRGHRRATNGCNHDARIGPRLGELPRTADPHHLQR